MKPINASYYSFGRLHNQPKELPRKLTEPDYQGGRKGDIFSAIPRKIDTGLPALLVALCSKSFKCFGFNLMPCKMS